MGKINLTDEEIVKALQCLAGERACDLCKYDDLAMQDGEKTCINLVAEDTLDLIHRLQSENKRLSLIASIVSKGVAVEIVNMQNTIEEQKAEIESLKSKSSFKNSWKNKFFKAQEEVKRLTEEANQDTITHIDICTENLSLRRQNAELQKQVDELKNAYNDLLDTCRNCDTTQAVKDKAKEIFEKIFFYRNRKDTTNFDNILLNMAKENGVVVE